MSSGIINNYKKCKGSVFTYVFSIASTVFSTAGSTAEQLRKTPWCIHRIHHLKPHMYCTVIKDTPNYTKNLAIINTTLLIVSQKPGFGPLGQRLTIWGKLIWSLAIQRRPIKHEKRASALNNLISATNINRLCLTCSGGQSAAHSDEILTIT